jgi:hypothetical protein
MLIVEADKSYPTPEVKAGNETDEYNDGEGNETF